MPGYIVHIATAKEYLRKKVEKWTKISYKVQ